MYGTELLSQVATDKVVKPTNLESVYYLFWEQGISFKEFNELPLPYIFGILKTHHYIKDKEKADYEKMKKNKGK